MRTGDKVSLRRGGVSRARRDRRIAVVAPCARSDREPGPGAGRAFSPLSEDDAMVLVGLCLLTMLLGSIIALGWEMLLWFLR